MVNKMIFIYFIITLPQGYRKNVTEDPYLGSLTKTQIQNPYIKKTLTKQCSVGRKLTLCHDSPTNTTKRLIFLI